MYCRKNTETTTKLSYFRGTELFPAAVEVSFLLVREDSVQMSGSSTRVSNTITGLLFSTTANSLNL